MKKATTYKAYKAHGNILTMPHLTQMNWDYKNQLLGATNGTFSSYYVYDATGNRVRKVVEKGNIIEERFYVGDYEVYRKTTNGTLDVERTTVHISDDQKRIAMIDNDGTTETIRYQIDNHLGSASLELDQNADIITYEEYHPFGTTSYRSGRTETEVSLKRYKYVGKERDEETGLYYYGARYYAAWIARFVSTDPMAGERSWVNPYNYVQNNPINRTDPTGAVDDWYFNEETGEYLGDDGAKTNNIRTISLEDWNSIDHNSPNKIKPLQCESSLISESSISGKTYAKIGNYFYSNKSNGLGFSLDELYNSSTSTPTYNTPPKFKNKSDAYMSARTDYSAIINYSKYDNAYDLQNDFVHERHHIINDVDKDVNAYRHLNAYDAQISHDTWQKTTATFQDRTTKNIGRYLFIVSKWGEEWKSHYNEKLEYFQNKLNVKYDFSAMQKYYKLSSGDAAPSSQVKYMKNDK